MHINVPCPSLLIFVVTFSWSRFPGPRHSTKYEQFPWFKSCHGQLLNRSPCQERLKQYYMYLKILLTIHEKCSKEIHCDIESC